MTSFVWRGLWECPVQTGLASSELIQKLREHDACTFKGPVSARAEDYFLNDALDTISAKPFYK